MIEEEADEEVRDAGLISAAQRVEHYEIAGYDCARTYAELLGDKAGAKLLQKTLDEEGATDKKLTELAVTVINVRERRKKSASVKHNECSGVGAIPPCGVKIADQ